MKPTICICGGGALGHTIAGVIAANGYMNVVLQTSSPQKWDGSIELYDIHGKTFHGKLQLVTDKASEAIPASDLILLCLPGYAIPHKLNEIKPYLNARQYVGSVVSSTGFFFMAKDLLPTSTKLFGFQRVPFIARVKQPGHSACLLGYKKQLKLGTINLEDNDPLPIWLGQALDCPVRRLNHYLDAALSNSNPILHTTRLYHLFHDYKAGTDYDREFLFYEEWDDATSELLIHCDLEFQRIKQSLPTDANELCPLLEYYESQDAQSLTHKIRSIEAFKGIKAPMLPADKPGHFVPDLQNRYFTEDFPYGLYILTLIAKQIGINTPYMNQVLAWGRHLLGNDVFVHTYFGTHQPIRF